MEREQLSPSKFADAIGVQRSNISHILSGRNKPSLELVNKILDRFQEINADWLLLGKGEMMVNHQRGPGPEELEIDLEQNKSKFPMRIILFYSDNSYQEFILK